MNIYVSHMTKSKKTNDFTIKKKKEKKKRKKEVTHKNKNIQIEHHKKKTR